MSSEKTSPGDGDVERVVAEARRQQKLREGTYRERALKLFPWVCAHCGREFCGKKLRELTVHHKDHNHDNNPPDGSNWELLCIYCHDNQHSRSVIADDYSTEDGPGSDNAPASTHKPFDGLEGLLKKKE
jgi:5-methylcytosine-specific restriction endonuclease McrA